MMPHIPVDLYVWHIIKTLRSITQFIHSFSTYIVKNLPVSHQFKMKLSGVGKLEEDVGIGRKDVVVDLALDVHGLRAEIELLELDLALSELLVATDIIVHHFHLQLHVVQGGDVEVKILAVHGVLLILLLGRLHLAKVLVEEGVVLLELELLGFWNID